MAERPEGFGLTAEVRKKLLAKYDENLAKECMEWIRIHVPDAQTIDTYGNGLSDETTVHEVLKDGVILCNLINALAPGTVKKVNNSNMAFKQMENICNFLTGMTSLGVNTHESFQTVDLYEAQNMSSVITALMALGRKAPKLGKVGMGPKESDKNERYFSEEQLKAGEGIVGMQAGAFKGANQSGQNFGKCRSIID